MDGHLSGRHGKGTSHSLKTQLKDRLLKETSPSPLTSLTPVRNDRSLFQIPGAFSLPLSGESTPGQELDLVPPTLGILWHQAQELFRTAQHLKAIEPGVSFK